MIFVDVEMDGLSRMEFFDPGNSLIFSRNVLAGSNQGLSFLGAVADAGEKIARVRLTSGANTISSNGIPGNPFDDVVVMDDFLFLKNSVGGRKSRSCFDRLSTNGIFSDHPTGELPFALSSPRSGRVEGVLVSSIEVSRFMPNRLPSRNRRV